MKKRVSTLLIVTVMLFAIPAYAVSSRTIDIFPNITFDGTEAMCSASITGDRTTDSIFATMTLEQGTRIIDEWSGSGSGILNLTGVAEVSHWRTYTLTVNATINGVAQPSVTISRTNN